MFVKRVLPTVGDLVARAIADTDFRAEILLNGDPVAIAADAADLAAEQWEEDHGLAMGRDRSGAVSFLIADTRAALVRRAESILRAARRDAADARRDAIDAGDLDRDGNPVAYASYRSAAR